ncbi:hypothetical protein ABZW18_16085 [Streptomyces sp. NPDC004647]|uniref:hypothetical protein n=1 Tax=Streptomyces sp. NPDC004647 TaxID=3154671 RepID=UPI0033A1D670
MIAWVCLVDRFDGRGRLLGSWRSGALAVTVALIMALVAVVTTAFLLPNASHVPPAAVALVGAGVSRRGRRQQETVTPLTAFLSLGVTRLLARLEERLDADRADWCDDMMQGFKNHWQMQIFADSVQRHLTARARDDKRKLKAVDERYEEVTAAFAHLTDVETGLDEACRENVTGLLGPRPRTLAETRLSRRAFGEAEERCKLLLRLAHEHGRRTDDRSLRKLKDRDSYTAGRNVPGRQRTSQRARWWGRRESSSQAR